MQTSRARTRGFSLIELVVVVAVIAVISALLAPVFIRLRYNAISDRAVFDVETMAVAMARVRSDTSAQSAACLTNLSGTLLALTGPGSCGAGLTMCVADKEFDGNPCWGGPYMATVTNDPWDNAYSATMDPVTQAVTVFCNGPDGILGTSDDLTSVQ